MPFTFALIALIVLVPAGLAGIWMGLTDLLSHGQHLSGAMAEIWPLVVGALPWCQPLLWLAGGTVMLILAATLVGSRLK
jgi:hypothetical protein